jgi:hypothetical protein
VSPLAIALNSVRISLCNAEIVASIEVISDELEEVEAVLDSVTVSVLLELAVVEELDALSSVVRADCAELMSSCARAVDTLDKKVPSGELALELELELDEASLGCSFSTSAKYFCASLTLPD